MSKKATKTPEELQAALQELIAQGRKEGMVRTSDLNAILEKMDLSADKIEEVYDRFEAMNIQVVGAELDLDLDDDLDLDLVDGLEDDISLDGLDDDDLVDPWCLRLRRCSLWSGWLICHLRRPWPGL